MAVEARHPQREAAGSLPTSENGRDAGHAPRRLRALKEIEPFASRGRCLSMRTPVLAGAGRRSGGVQRRPRLQSRQSLRAAETLPPFFSSSSITRLWSQMFISALPSLAPV